jgi:uncharacterized membrane protein
VIITIMVLNLPVPHGADWQSLRPDLPVFGNYVVSYVFIGIYWSNHHHLLHTMTRVNGKILWANLHLLFWLSLIPFITRWVGETRFAPEPVAAYGVDLLLAAFAYRLLELAIIADQGKNSKLASTVGTAVKERLSLALYVAAIPLAFYDPWISCGIYILVALMWLVPDRRIERALKE